MAQQPISVESRFANSSSLLAVALVCLALAGCPAPRHDVGTPSAHAVEPDCSPPPFSTPLFLRGSMSNWALDDDYEFQYQCNSYVLNVNLAGTQRFRITDAATTPNSTFGAASGAAAITARTAFDLHRGSGRGGAGDLKFEFAGEHTIRLTFERTRDDSVAQPKIIIGPKDFDDSADAPVTDPVALSLKFDSRGFVEKGPFGAVTAGTPVEYNLSASPGVTQATLIVQRRRLEGPQEVLDYADVARVPLTRTTQGERETWHGSYRYADIGIYGYYFEVEIGGKTYLYENNRDAIYWTREKGSGGLGKVEGTGDPLQRIRRYRQTVYRDDYHVPAWAKDVIYYYIFPERFRNGNPSNDPRPGVDVYKDKGIEFHKNWLDKPWLPRSGDGSDNEYGNDFFGGDIQGIIDKLDYIAGLGANALYITPMFRAASNHKYDTADYRNIDPHFGSNADFVRLTKEAARRGIRVIPDTSLNHSGSDSIYFDRYDHYDNVSGGPGAFKGEKIRPDSPYADWYKFDPTQSDPDKQYRGWSGAQDLPELNKASPSYRNFAFGAADSVMKLWLDRGASGWRMDVAPWIPDEFWRDWRTAIKQKRPDALTIAETQFDASKFFLGDEFDSTMNYIFRNVVEAYANGAKASVAYRNIELMRENYPPQAFYALMNLLSTHDTARALFDFGYRDEKTDAATIALAKQRLRLAVFFQMIFPGAPAVFYGDEVGVTGGDDPFNRVTYPWPDLGGKPDNDLLAEYKKLIKLRKDLPVLRHGSIEAPAYIDDHVIVLIRRGEGWAITATNNDSTARTVTVKLPADMRTMKFTDALTGKVVAAADSAIELTVPALYGSALLAQGTAQPNVHVLPTPLTMPGLDRKRTIRVYLPPGYDASNKRYPVLYMHDGQNLFDATTAYAGEWEVDETLNALARSKGLELIVVGVDNGGVERIHELNPWDNDKFGQGEGKQYMRFLVDVVKPYIDRNYRTRTDRANTAIMGSSMGGLISQYAIDCYPNVFSKAGIFSPAYWLAPPVFDYARTPPPRADAKLYFYAGGKESEGMVPDMQRMIDLLREKKHPEKNLSVKVNPNAQHNEAAWRAEFAHAVLWLFASKQ